tara:strand:+ start:312 stop:527 length:216 start_codon:yes stop_codon:yes gene_type:complete
MAVTYLGDNGPDGMCFGLSASEKIAFFGATPVVQQAVTVTATTTATTTLLETRAARIEAAMVALGLITTAG